MLNIFSCTHWPLCIFFGVTSFAHVLIGLFGLFLLLSCVSSLCILNINPLSGIWFANIFSPSHRWLYHFVDGFFAVQKIFSLMQSHLFIFYFVACVSGFISKKSLQSPTSRTFIPVLFQIFIVSGFTFKLLIHFELIFVSGIKIWVQFHLFPYEYPIIPHHSLRRLSFPLSILGFFVKYQLTLYAWVYFCVLNFVPLVYLSVFMPVPYCFDYYSFIAQLEIEKCEQPTLLFFLKWILSLGSKDGTTYANQSM